MVKKHHPSFREEIRPWHGVVVVAVLFLTVFHFASRGTSDKYQKCHQSAEEYSKEQMTRIIIGTSSVSTPRDSSKPDTDSSQRRFYDRYFNSCLQEFNLR